MPLSERARRQKIADKAREKFDPHDMLRTYTEPVDHLAAWGCHEHQEHDGAQEWYEQNREPSSAAVGFVKTPNSHCKARKHHGQVV